MKSSDSKDRKSQLFLTDIDECESSPCHANANCINTLGSYVCNCSTGFHGNDTHCQGKTSTATNFFNFHGSKIV